MSEFNNRIIAQRDILKIVNNKVKHNEELCSISKSAIDRWSTVNKIYNGEIISLLYEISDKLFFLANKSQEQITEDYLLLSEEISSLKYNLLNLLELYKT
jgi:hypothetical protein